MPTLTPRNAQAASPGLVTGLLARWCGGNQEALDELMPLVYGELRKMARQRLRVEPQNATVQATALVHEVYLKFIDQDRVNWRGRAHFFAVAAQAMRRILVDHARRRYAAKRGAGGEALSLHTGTLVPGAKRLDLVALDDALKGLAKFDPRAGQVVELKFFGGLSIAETAEVMGASPATIKREWAVARAWLHQELRVP